MECSLCSHVSLHWSIRLSSLVHVMQLRRLPTQGQAARRVWGRSKGGGLFVCVHVYEPMCVNGLDMCVQTCELCYCVYTFMRGFAIENPFLYKNRITFLRQKCWVSTMMVRSFRRRFSEIGARNLLIVLGDDRRGNAWTALRFLFQPLDPLSLPMHI